jgi:hypothetical protein
MSAYTVTATCGTEIATTTLTISIHAASPDDSGPAAPGSAPSVAGDPGTAGSTTPQAKPTLSMGQAFTEGKTGLTASVQDQGPGAHYIWLIDNGRITSGDGTPNITFTAGTMGSLWIGLSISTTQGSHFCTAIAHVLAKPSAKIKVLKTVHPGQAWMQASVPSHEGCTYRWTVIPGTANATLTSGTDRATVGFATDATEGDFQIQAEVRNQVGDLATTQETVQVRRGIWVSRDEKQWFDQHREKVAATLLANGQVLVVGSRLNLPNHPGMESCTAALYNPATNLWASIRTESPLTDPVAILLGDGRVAVTGRYLGRFDIFNPATNTWQVGPDGASLKGEGFTATLLKDQRQVLVAGGRDRWVHHARLGAQIYDTKTQTWEDAGDLLHGHTHPTATLLKDGQVLVTGPNQLVERYDPEKRAWSQAESKKWTVRLATATLLPDGKVLVAGEKDLSSGFTAEVYDPAADAWTETEVPKFVHHAHAATLMPNGKVLVTGGEASTHDQANTLKTAEIYNPRTGAWSETGPMQEGRTDHATVLLKDGSVLAILGSNTNLLTERYLPVSTDGKKETKEEERAADARREKEHQEWVKAEARRKAEQDRHSKGAAPSQPKKAWTEDEINKERQRQREEADRQKKEAINNAYKIFGLDPKKSYTHKEIEKLFRKLALPVHPDRNRDPEATEKFKALSAARDLLYAIYRD